MLTTTEKKEKKLKPETNTRNLFFFNRHQTLNLLPCIYAQKIIIDSSLQQPARWQGLMRREYRRDKFFPEENIALSKAFNKLIVQSGELEKLAPEQRLLLIHEWLTGKNEYRKENVRIGHYRDFAGPREVPELIAEMFLQHESTGEDPVRKAVKIHLDILLIHPFADGNGRTARLLASYYLLKAGFRSTLFTGVEEHFSFDPGEYTRLLGLHRSNATSKETIYTAFLKAMMINSWYASWFRQRQITLLAVLKEAGLDTDEAILLLTQFDLGVSLPGIKMLDKKTKKNFVPWYQLKQQFSPLELNLLTRQLERLRVEEMKDKGGKGNPCVGCKKKNPISREIRNSVFNSVQ